MKYHQGQLFGSFAAKSSTIISNVYTGHCFIYLLGSVRSDSAAKPPADMTLPSYRPTLRNRVFQTWSVLGIYNDASVRSWHHFANSQPAFDKAFFSVRHVTTLKRALVAQAQRLVFIRSQGFALRDFPYNPILADFQCPDDILQANRTLCSDIRGLHQSIGVLHPSLA